MYATEALRAWLEVYWALPRQDVTLEGRDVGEHGMEIESLLAETALANVGSRRVLVKCGFTEHQAREEDGHQLIRTFTGHTYDWVARLARISILPALFLRYSGLLGTI